MSATTTVWNGKRATARTIVQYSDAAGVDTMTKALVSTEREVRVTVQQGDRRTLRGSWVKTAEGLRLRWAVGE
jgi:hypothetical protein